MAPPPLQACSGKFHPIKQWFYFDSLECLPEDEASLPDEAVTAPVGSRYDGQTAVFGTGFQKKLESLKYFVVSNVEESQAEVSWRGGISTAPPAGCIECMRSFFFRPRLGQPGSP